MADYFTQFSCLFDLGTAENAARAEDIRYELAAELYRDEGGYPGFAMEHDHESGPSVVWLYSDEYGEPEHVISFVLRCAEAFNLVGLWAFTWSHSCSKARVDAFGGGALVIELAKRETVADIDCNNFVIEHASQPAVPPETARQGRSP